MNEPIYTVPSYHWQRGPNGTAELVYQWLDEPVRYNKRNLLFAIANTEKNRSSYVTDEAWQNQLTMFREGLAVFDCDEKEIVP